MGPFCLDQSDVQCRRGSDIKKPPIITGFSKKVQKVCPISGLRSGGCFEIKPVVQVILIYP